MRYLFSILTVFVFLIVGNAGVHCNDDCPDNVSLCPSPQHPGEGFCHPLGTICCGPGYCPLGGTCNTQDSNPSCCILPTTVCENGVGCCFTDPHTGKMHYVKPLNPTPGSKVLLKTTP